MNRSNIDKTSNEEEAKASFEECRASQKDKILPFEILRATHHAMFGWIVNAGALGEKNDLDKRVIRLADG